MNAWQKRFTQKMEGLKNAAEQRFHRFATQSLAPIFEELRAFVEKFGITAQSPLSREGIRTFRFEVNENTYCLLTFRADGMERCDVLCEFYIPQIDKIDPIRVSEEIRAIDAKWGRSIFEQALDLFIEGLTGTYGYEPEPQEATV